MYHGCHEGNETLLPSEFFEQVAYLFEDWGKYERCRVTKDNLEVYWAVTSTQCERPDFDTLEIPNTVTLQQEVKDPGF